MSESKKICPRPWTFCEIHKNGDVYPCCPVYCKGYSFGNLNFKSFEEIWNSAKAKYFRHKILKGDYSLCDLNTCVVKQRIDINELDINDIEPKYPKIIKRSDDDECNAACITCRDCQIKNTETDEENLNNISNKLKTAINNIEILNCSGSGDPIASRWIKKFLTEAAKNNKNLKFYISTNGILMTKKICQEMGIYGRIYEVSISLPGATEETYNKIVRYGNYKKVIENIEWISRDENIEEKELNFVLHIINYKELPEIIEIADKYNFKLNCTHFRYWYWRNLEFGKNYADAAVWLPENPEYNDFVKIMNTDIVKKHKECFDNTLGKFIE